MCVCVAALAVSDDDNNKNTCTMVMRITKPTTNKDNVITPAVTDVPVNTINSVMFRHGYTWCVVIVYSRMGVGQLNFKSLCLLSCIDSFFKTILNRTIMGEGLSKFGKIYLKAMSKLCHTWSDVRPQRVYIVKCM